ncbi:ATP-binding protein [Alloiococcus sp. CFN-8]|uniref:ATP-binding protein n=1 Tax=Alloiococcus sp. CFN-8 TaxID=3416081 RepID=UPI003CE6D349
MIRRIVEINKELCNGCGICLKACHEAAIILRDGKAELLKDIYCDGLGDCLKGCPEGAIKIIEREAEEYDVIAVEKRVNTLNKGKGLSVNQGCKSMSNSSFGKREESELVQWPVQLQLMNPRAEYFQGSELLIAAQCSAFSHKNFHDSFMRDKITIIACPKLFDKEDSIERLKAIIQMNNIKSIDIVKMEVPCCNGLASMVLQALEASKATVNCTEATLKLNGELI